MRLVPALAAFLAVACIAAPSSAQTSFQHVQDSGPTPVYWDAASIKCAGDTFEIDVLQVFKTGAGKPLEGDLTRHRLSCVWTASVGGMLGIRTIDEAGKVKGQSGPEPFAQGSFYGPHAGMRRWFPLSVMLAGRRPRACPPHSQ